MTLTIIVLALMAAAALWTVLTPTLLKAAIGLGVTSALLTIVMFQMDSPLAAVFELSVCTGLITAVFASTISLTRPKDRKQSAERNRLRWRAFLPLAGLMVIVGLAFWLTSYDLKLAAPPTGQVSEVRDVLWNVRRFDLVGQILVIFAGVFGVVILFKERSVRREKTEGNKP